MRTPHRCIRQSLRMNSSPTVCSVAARGGRMRIASFGRRFYLFWLGACAAYAAILLSAAFPE